ncbi:hypothetical protein CAEBREN_10033 [Caenorhabditis brenneri]|uniref:Sdz-33 F-box domain-containing protein n=1 Tax=Caenorhabditis brenneri TaxID=135651 RepID=G0NS82_CAEBE|nr:hypothetical protein CAEBREN_10033 [Caenorhabditis brenneri]
MGSQFSYFPPVPCRMERPLFQTVESEDPEDDFFEVFKLVFCTDNFDRYTEKYKLNARWTMIVMDVDGKDHVDVMYRGKKYVFNLVLAVNSYDIGKLVPTPQQHPEQESTLVADYYYGRNHNRFDYIYHRIMHITSSCALILRFNDPCRDIREMSFAMFPYGLGVEINKPSVTPEELDYIGTMSILNYLLLNTKIPKGYEAFALKYKIGYIANAEGLTLDQLKTIKCHYLFIGKSNFTSSDMNQFMKAWMNKELSEEFYMLHIKEFDKSEDLYNGIDYKQWDEAVRDSRYRIFDGKLRFDLSTSIDITRDDGTIASFYPESKNIFHFSVWYSNRFPKVQDEQDFDLNTPPELADYSYWTFERPSFIILECIFGRSFDK